MDSRNRMGFALAAGVLVMGVSIVVAIVTFKFLDSQASGSVKDWKFGGAFAGFVFTAGLLTSIIFQFYRQMTGDRIEEYRQQIAQLQMKLIKGATAPAGFTIDLDERHKLVFARPSQWAPREGVLYQYEERHSKDRRPDDPVPANFNVVYRGKDELLRLVKGGEPGDGRLDPDNLYSLVVQRNLAMLKDAFPSYEHGSVAEEFVIVDSMKSFKYMHSYTVTAEAPHMRKVNMMQTGVLIFVPKQTALYEFTFTDDQEDYLRSSEVFNTVVSSIRFL